MKTNNTPHRSKSQHKSVMKKWLCALVILIILIILTLIFLMPNYIGGHIKAEQTATIQTLANEGIDIKITQYQRGWFKSKALATITLSNESSWHRNKMKTHPLSFDVVLHIYQGPIMLPRTVHGRQIEFGKAFIVMEMIKPQIPLDATIKAAFDNSRSFWLNLPQYQSATGQPAIIQINNLKIKGEYSALFKEFKSAIKVDEATLSTPDASEKVVNVNYDVDLRNIENGLSIGKRGLVIHQIVITPKKGKPLLINNLQLMIDMKPGTPNKVNYHLALSTENYVYDNINYGPNSLAFQLENIDSALLVAIKQDLEMMNSDAANADAVNALALRLKINHDFLSLLSKGLIFNLSDLKLVTPWGQFTAKGNVHLPNTENQSFSDFIKQSSAKLNVSIPEPLLQYIALQYFQLETDMNETKASDEAKPQIALQQVENYLQSIVRKNWLVKHNNHYELKLHIEKGDIKLNDKAIQLFPNDNNGNLPQPIQTSKQ